MSFTLRAKRVLVGAMAGAMVLSLMPAGMASAGTEEVCANAPDSGFPDKGATHGDNIDCMFAYDVFQGRVDGTFGTFANITRGAAAQFFVNFAVAATDGAIEVPDGDVPFTDMGLFEDAISALYLLGLVDGTSATTFSPAAEITRGQFAKILYEAHVALGVEFADEYDEAFPDQGDTFGAEIAALAGEGIISGFADGTFRPFTNITRGAAASLLAESAGVLDDAGLWLAPRLPPTDVIGPNQTFTNAPELVSVEKGSGGIVRFNFDKSVPGIQAVSNNFALYTPQADRATPTELSISGSTVLTRFTPQEVGSAVRAGARTGAVADAGGLLSIAGDFPLRASAVQASPLKPNLVSVGNYRFADDIALGEQRVLVDFVFDSPTAVTSPAIVDAITDATNYHLVGVNSQRFDALAEDTSTPSRVGDLVTITVPFAMDPTEVPQTQLRRGVFEVLDIVWSSNFAATGGTTVDPDLVSVTREGTSNIFRFTFDEAVSAAVGELTPAQAAQFGLVDQNLGLINGTSATRSAIEADGAAVVRVQFTVPDGFIPVHGFVEEDAVLATDSTDSDNAGRNRAAAQPVSIPVLADPAPGVTTALDLVSAERFQNEVTGRYTIRFTFDQTVPAVDPDNYEWNLYDAAGVRFQVETVVGLGITPSGSWVEVSSANAGITDDQIEATVTVSVQQKDVFAATTMTEGQSDARQVTLR